MEGVIAIASSCRLLLVRVSDEGGYEELWSYTMLEVQSRHLAFAFVLKILI